MTILIFYLSMTHPNTHGLFVGLFDVYEYCLQTWSMSWSQIVEWLFTFSFLFLLETREMVSFVPGSTSRFGCSQNCGPWPLYGHFSYRIHITADVGSFVDTFRRSVTELLTSAVLWTPFGPHRKVSIKLRILAVLWTDK